MRHERFLRTGLRAAVPLGLIALLAGCPGTGTNGPFLLPPTVTGVTVTATTGNLLLNQANTVTVRATAVDPDGTVVAVSADLSQIGGSNAQPLTFNSETNTWVTITVIVPTTLGTRQVTFTATDNDNRTGQATTSVNVAVSDGGTNIPPTLTNPLVTGTFQAGFVSQIVVSATASDPDGTVQIVTANLLPIGGLPNQLLTLSPQIPNLWTFTGLITPLSAGTFPIVFTTTDNLGATGTTSTTAVVNNPIP